MRLPAVAGPDGRLLDRVQVVGLAARGHHGVFDHEREDGQDFVVDVVLHLDARPAAASDDLADTVDYGALSVALLGVVRGEPVKLIETLADRLARTCLADPRVAAADVSVHKPQAPIPEVFADVVVTVRRTRADVVVPDVEGPDVEGLDRRPAAPVPAVLALGANLGDPAATLAAAVRELDAEPGIRVRVASPVVQTAPVGGPEQPDYLNAVVLVDVGLSPHELLAACRRIEAAHGRVRDIRWGARTLDLDVIDYAGLVAASADLELPHPRAAGRAFVLDPWLRADPSAQLPASDGGARVADLLAAAPDRLGVRLRDDVSLRVVR